MIFLAKNNFIEYINKAEFDKALKELTETTHSNDSENKIKLALLKRYQGNFDAAIQILEEIYTQKEQLDDVINTQLCLLLLYFYHATNKPSTVISNIKSFLQYLKTQIQIEDLGPFWQAINKYSDGKWLEAQGELPEAIKRYLEAASFLEKQDNKYELMHGFFLLGSTYRMYGDYVSAQEYLEKSLKVVPKADDFRKAQFMNYLSEIFFLRSKTHYRKALDYLNNSLSVWKSLNLQFGVAWSIHDLALVYYMAGDLPKAFEFLKTSYGFITADVDVQFKIRNLLSLIELGTELKFEQDSKNYFEELKDLIQYDFLYEDELQLAEAFMLRKSQRLSDQMFALKIFEKLNRKNQLQYELKIKALLNHLDLALVELKFAQSDEAISATKGVVKQILEYSEKSYDLLVQATVLIEKFTTLIDDKQQELPFNSIALKELNPLLHSIPRLTILLYILPRKGVTFSELEEATGLTQGNISTHTSKLLQEGVLASEKMFINSKVATVYSMTDNGVKEFETYARSLTEILQSFLINY